MQGSTLQSLTESMDVRGELGPSWFGELQIFSVRLFWRGSQCLLHQLTEHSLIDALFIIQLRSVATYVHTPLI